MSPNLPKVYLARHGETEWSVSGQHTGLTDIPLTPRGERDGLQIGERLKGMSFALVLTSPLQRARRTCDIASFGDRAVDDPDLREWHYGKYEGLKSAEIQADHPGWNVFRNGCPGGESPAEIGARIDRVIERIRGADGDVLLFAHGHSLRVLAARWLGLPPGDGRLFRLNTATISILSYEHNLDSPVILLWNDGHHLKG